MGRDAVQPGKHWVRRAPSLRAAPLTVRAAVDDPNAPYAPSSASPAPATARLVM